MTTTMTRCVLAGLLAGFGAIALAQAGSPKAIYESTCAACHATGVIGAPKFGDAAQWQERLKKGRDALYKSALNGTPKGMPPKGGKAELTDTQIKATVDYLISGGAATTAKADAKPDAKGDAKKAPAKGNETVAKAAPAAPAAPSASAPAAAAAPSTAAPAAPATPAAVPAPAAAPAAPTQQAAAAPPVGSAAEVNAFNRLLRPATRYNLPAAESGIHDPANDAVRALQPPALAFADLPKSLAGNRVDWVKALENKKIAPRWEKVDPKAQPAVMDLNIVREVKGSMPDVVYPHKQHTEWLDCANCHPSIFVPQKGANQISMAAILLGQKCGVCHGKVAFPVSECRLCHSKKKELADAPHALPDVRAEARQ
jgi:c(7)-type cytochrome triheme protein